MFRKFAFITASGLCVTACVPQVPTVQAPSFGSYALSRLNTNAIAPTTDVKVGRIYRSGSASGINLVGNSRFSELCPRDFSRTRALKNLDSSVFVTSTTSDGGSYNQQLSIKPKVGGIGWDILIGSISGGYTSNAKIEYTKLSSVEAPAGARQTILSAIGTECRQDIAKHRKAGRQVVVITRGVRADEATITLIGGAGIDGGSEPNKLRVGDSATHGSYSGGISATNTEVFKERRVFLGVNTDSLGNK